MNAPSRLAFSPAKWIGIRSCHFVNEAPVSLMAILSIARRAVRPFAYSALTEPRKEGTVSPFLRQVAKLPPLNLQDAPCLAFLHSQSRPRTCQPPLAERPPYGPGWLHEIKFDGYRVIARKDGKHVRLWARTTSDYSKSFTRVRDAVAALPVDSAVLDGEAIGYAPPTTPSTSRR